MSRTYNPDQRRRAARKLRRAGHRQGRHAMRLELLRLRLEVLS